MAKAPLTVYRALGTARGRPGLHVVCGRAHQAGEEGALPLLAEERSRLGADQRAWLDERLADLARPWSLVANGVVVNEIVCPADLDLSGGR